MVPPVSRLNDADPGESATVMLASTVDRLADSFEEGWTEHSIENLEKILAPIPLDQQDEVCREFFTVDIELRFKNSKRVDVDEYARRFPKYVKEAKAAFAKVLASRRLGEYEYYELLGKGGMGHVYRGFHRLLGRPVAIKLLNQKIFNTPGGLERFCREIQLSGRLKHPNLINAEYAGEVDDRYYLVMELIEGQNLNDIVKSHGPLSIPVACEILRQTAQGLQSVCENGFVHRDIKPGNLMISHEGLIKIIDFGLGKLMDHSLPTDDGAALTAFGTVLGSIDFVAPEQLTDATSATIRSDIYSLGCVFYFLLTGHAPFGNKSMSRDRKLIAHIRGEIPSLADGLEDCPEEIEQFYQKMVACKPQDRFSHPSDIIEFTTPRAASEGLQILLPDLDDSRSDVSRSSALAKSLFTSKNAAKTTTFSQKVRRYTGPIILALFVGYGVSLVFDAFSDKNHNASPVPPAVADSRAHAEWETVALGNEQAATLQFPGYSGQWWFEDVPHLLPFVREKMAAANLTPDQIHAADFAGESEATRKLLEFLFKEKTNRAHVVDLEILVDRFFTEIGTVALEGRCEISAAVEHSRAVLMHCLGVLRSDPELERRALKSYEQAIETTESSRYLAALCRSDLARLHYTIGGNADEFQKEMRALALDQNDNILFRLHLQTIPVLEQMKSGKQQDAVFEKTFHVLQSLGSEDSPHPMLLPLHKLYAEALTRQWRIDMAEREWQTVEQLARRIALRSGVSDREAKCGRDVVQAVLTCAALARYRGELQKARRLYRDLIAGAQDPQTCADAWEGLGDTTLFVPTHFNTDVIPHAAISVAEAQSAYLEAIKLSPKPEDKFVQQCKLALLQFQMGTLEPESQHRLLENIRDEYWTIVLEPDGDERVRAYFLLVEALMDQEHDAVTSIREYLERSRLIPNLCHRYAGERLDRQLLATRVLLELQKEGHDSAARQDLVQYLDPILLQHLAAEVSMRPFLLPFYDLAIHSDTDIVQSALRIWTTRNQVQTEKEINARCVFYFPLGKAEGFVLFLSSDLKQKQRFELGLTRQQILDAARKGQILPLPTEVRNCLQTQWSKAKSRDISWDDSICWSDEMSEFRLAPDAWCFEFPLEQQ